MEKFAPGRKAGVIAMVAISAVAVGILAVVGFMKWRAGDDGPPQKDMTMNAGARREVIESLISTLTQSYVFPEKAAVIERGLRAQLVKGEFDNADSAKQFARMLTEHVQALVPDRHLEVRYFEAPIPVPEAGKEDDDSPEEAAKALREGLRMNFGVETVGRLYCNLGYIELRQFGRPAQVASRIQAAMALVGDTRALVIDLRRTRGGDPETVMLVGSYLFDQPTHLNDIYWREGDRIETRWTTAQVTGRRYGAARPIVILTSEETFSAGEDFGYALKHAGRAVLIGETTGGGAHPGSRRRLTAHFMMNVPTGRAINPVTKTDWEGVGVVPDIAVRAKKALVVGQESLLRKLLAGETDPEWRRRMNTCLEELK
jgi:Peptidase family S41/N-terminal domain of Peptidase_S41 in eukaryotic IRBP